jgi:hypothetical protein
VVSGYDHGLVSIVVEHRRNGALSLGMRAPQQL